MRNCSDSDSSTPPRMRLRNHAEDSSGSDEGRRPGGILAAGVMLGFIAVESVRDFAMRWSLERQRKRRNRRDTPPECVLSAECLHSDIEAAVGGDSSCSESVTVREIGVGQRVRDFSGPGYNVREIRDHDPRGRIPRFVSASVDGGMRKPHMDEFSEFTLEGSEGTRDDEAHDGSLTSFSGWTWKEQSRCVVGAWPKMERIASRLYSRTRVDGTCLTEILPRKETMKKEAGTQKGCSKQSRRAKSTGPVLWQGEVSHPNADAANRALRWRRAMRSSGLADVCMM